MTRTWTDPAINDRGTIIPCVRVVRRPFTAAPGSPPPPPGRAWFSTSPSSPHATQTGCPCASRIRAYAYGPPATRQRVDSCPTYQTWTTWPSESNLSILIKLVHLLGLDKFEPSPVAAPVDTLRREVAPSQPLHRQNGQNTTGIMVGCGQPIAQQGHRWGRDALGAAWVASDRWRRRWPHPNLGTIPSSPMGRGWGMRCAITSSLQWLSPETASVHGRNHPGTWPPAARSEPPR